VRQRVCSCFIALMCELCGGGSEVISRYDKHYSITIDRCEVVTPMLINNSDTDQWQLSFLVFSL